VDIITGKYLVPEAMGLFQMPGDRVQSGINEIGSHEALKICPSHWFILLFTYQDK